LALSSHAATPRCGVAATRRNAAQGRGQAEGGGQEGGPGEEGQGATHSVAAWRAQARKSRSCFRARAARRADAAASRAVRAQNVEDKTFGLKNKNKSVKVQKCVALAAAPRASCLPPPRRHAARVSSR
jgi:hypothetical protein